IGGCAAASGTADAATQTWTPDEASEAQVDYGTSSTYGSSSALNATKVTGHSVSRICLVANTTYHYHVKSRDAAGKLATSGDYTFTTAASGGSGGGGGSTAPVISVLSTGSLTTSGATITWTTDNAGDTQVDYGTSASYRSRSALTLAQVTAHSATLAGLVAGTLCRCRVESPGA